MKIRLISDFIDVYDPWFDQNPNLPIFRRVVKDGIGRPARLSLMALFGLPVPPHGRSGRWLTAGAAISCFTSMSTHTGARA